MPLLTTIIDDKSPLISYDSTWLPGTSLNDNLAINYYLGTFQKNSVSQGAATFNFNGTAFWIYGANRQNHGTYVIQVDGNNFPSVNGSGNDLFQQSLFNTSLKQALHTVKLTNTGTNGLFVDIDMIVWQSEVGNTGDQLVPELVPDVDPRFQYQQNTWATTSASSSLNLNLFNNGSGHVTQTTDATVSFTFIAVTLYGTSGPANGPYAVQLDGGQTVQYNATNAYPTNYGVVIYHANNLGPGSHQLLLTNLPAQSGQYLTIDYAQLWTVATSSNTSVVSPSVTPCVPSSNNNLLASHKLSSGAIAGLVVEGVVAVLAALAAAFFYWRWRTALRTPTGYYTPIFRSPEATVATGIAPSVETRSNPSSLQPSTTFQPLSTVGRTSQQFETDTASSRDMGSPGRAPNEGQALAPRLLPGAPGGNDQRPPFGAPPGYDTAVRGAHPNA